jgi:hypothetical protein
MRSRDGDVGTRPASTQRSVPCRARHCAPGEYPLLLRPGGLVPADSIPRAGAVVCASFVP